MAFGFLAMNKRYSLAQIVRLKVVFSVYPGLIPVLQAAVAVVSTGVILATLSRPSSPEATDASIDIGRYTVGVTMLTFSLFLTATLGVLQERTYTQYGPHWKEGVFYTVSFTALPQPRVPSRVLNSGALLFSTASRCLYSCSSSPI